MPQYSTKSDYYTVIEAIRISKSWLKIYVIIQAHVQAQNKKNIPKCLTSMHANTAMPQPNDQWSVEQWSWW